MAEEDKPIEENTETEKPTESFIGDEKD